MSVWTKDKCPYLEVKRIHKEHDYTTWKQTVMGCNVHLTMQGKNSHVQCAPSNI